MLDMTIVLFVFVAGVFLVGLAFLYVGLRGSSLNDFLAGLVVATAMLVAVGLGFVYFVNQGLRFEPHDAASSVSNAPG
jgi:hypothetical protein